MRLARGILCGLTLAFGGITVVAAAGDLTNRCSNAEFGFSVSYPSDWHTNERAVVHDSVVAGCTVFAPFDNFEILSEAVNVPVFLKHQSGPLHDEGTPITIDGRTGRLVETTVNGQAWYVYYAEMDADTVFAGFAFDNGSAPFEESKAVLDAMIGTLDLDGDQIPDTALRPDAGPPWIAIGSLILVITLTTRRLRHTSRVELRGC